MSDLSAHFDDAMDPGKWLPEQGLPNNHVGDGWNSDPYNELQYRDDLSRFVTYDGTEFGFVANVPDVKDRTALALANDQTGDLALYTFDREGNQWSSYPGTNAREWASSYLNGGDSNNRRAEHTPSHTSSTRAGKGKGRS